MHLHIFCVLAWVSLHFAAAGTKWEVINDVKPYDDTGTQEDILSQEDLIPFRAAKFRPKPHAPKPKKLDEGKTDTKSHQKVTSAPSPPAKMKGGSEMEEEEELLPLGAPKALGGQRHLLQMSSGQVVGMLRTQGPHLPFREELKRQQLRNSAVNFSTACKNVDEDCLFDVSDFVAQQLAAGILDEKDFAFSDENPISRSSEEQGRIPHSRHKRQITNTGEDESDDDDSDDSEGSGSSSSVEENLYSNQTSHEFEGEYKIDRQIGFNFPNATLTDLEKGEFKDEIEKQIINAFDPNFPGFAGVVVGEPYLQNGTLLANYTILVDGKLARAAANEVGETDLEDYLFEELEKQGLPAFNNIIVFGNNITDDSKLTSVFVDALRTVLDNYCGSDNPCPDGPEFNVSACFNTGFMTGTCPHKCNSYPCQNKAVCELNKDYQPICNCGSRYTGEYCEKKLESKTGLTTGETVGVGVASAAACLALLSCCMYFLFCRRRNRDVRYSYYEDEGSQDQLSDPTSVANYYIDRPIISQTPIAVFNSQAGFDA